MARPPCLNHPSFFKYHRQHVPPLLKTWWLPIFHSINLRISSLTLSLPLEPETSQLFQNVPSPAPAFISSSHLPSHQTLSPAVLCLLHKGPSQPLPSAHSLPAHSQGSLASPMPSLPSPPPPTPLRRGVRLWTEGSDTVRVRVKALEGNVGTPRKLRTLVGLPVQHLHSWI